ncbi:GNAT family protein [Actinoplanes sp. NPDC051851]|uniref:GNAT family N-acetyltransferase n=1 Tax=Actinoplanes sp. NPDC051851 TaxID=3154753 RepID=UPI00341F88B7
MSVSVRPVVLDDAAELTALLIENRAYHRPWDPARPEDFYTVDVQRQILVDLARAGTSFPYAIVEEGTIVGRINLNNVVRGPFLSGSLGYWMAERRTGRGVASAAVSLTLREAFVEHGLHRVEAATLLHNVRSQRVLEKNGFQRFGTAPRYLRIAGEWQDHHLYQLTTENWSPAPADGS